MTMTTFLSYTASAALHYLTSSVLWLTQKARLIKDYALDYDGLWYDLLIEALAPRYDSSASGLPWFAYWNSGGTQFFKLGQMTVIVER